MDDIRYCIADNQGCIGRIGMNKSLGCIQNPAVGREKEWGEGTLEKANVQEEGYDRRRRPGGHVGRQDGRPARTQGHPLSTGTRLWAARF